jgi:hypothetical protein
MLKINKVLKGISRKNRKSLLLVLTGSIYGLMWFVSTICNAASYPTSTTTPLATDLSMNANKLYDMSDVITRGPWVDARIYNGGAFNNTTISTAITAIGSNYKTLLLAYGTWTISANVTVPSNINLRFEQGAILSIGAGYTVTINGPIDAPVSQIFSNISPGTGGVARFGTGVSEVREAYPQWWGAIGDGVSDDYYPFISAVDAVRSTGIALRVPSGTYKISAELPIYYVSIIGDSWPIPTFVPTSGCARLFNVSNTVGDITDYTELRSIMIDLKNAPVNGVAIGSDKGLAGKRFVDIEIGNSIGPGKATIKTNNHTGIKLRRGSYDMLYHMEFHNIRLWYCYQGIDLYDSLWGGGVNFATHNKFSKIISNSYRAIQIQGITNTFEGIYLYAYGDFDSTDGDYELKLLGYANSIDTLWCDREVAAIGPTVRYQAKNNNFISCGIAMTDFVEIDSSGNVVATLDGAGISDMADGGYYAQDVLTPHIKPNFAVNPFFDFWLAGTSFSSPDNTVIAEGWKGLKNGATFTISKETLERKYSMQSCKVDVAIAPTPGYVAGLQQRLMADHGFWWASLGGKDMSLGVIAKGTGTLGMYGTGGSLKTYTLSSTTWEPYIMTMPMSYDMEIYIGLTTTGTLYVDSVMLYPGTYSKQTLRPTRLNPEFETSKMKFTKIGDKYHYYGTAAPTAGTWAVGDITWNTAPAAGGYSGWICVTAGTPGTWKGFGSIAP